MPALSALSIAGRAHAAAGGGGGGGGGGEHVLYGNDEEFGEDSVETIMSDNSDDQSLNSARGAMRRLRPRGQGPFRERERLCV